MMNEPPPPDATWMHILWIAVSVLWVAVSGAGAMFVHDLRSKIKGKVSQREFDGYKGTLRDEMAKDRETFRLELKADRDACEGVRGNNALQLADHETRIRSLDTFRADVGALAVNVGNLGSQVENLANVSDQHHKQNRSDASDRDRATEEWRTKVMAPTLDNLSRLAATHTEAILALKKSDEDKEQRLRDLEQRRTRTRSKK